MRNRRWNKRCSDLSDFVLVFVLQLFLLMQTFCAFYLMMAVHSPVTRLIMEDTRLGRMGCIFKQISSNEQIFPLQPFQDVTFIIYLFISRLFLSSWSQCGE